MPPPNEKTLIRPSLPPFLPHRCKKKLKTLIFSSPSCVKSNTKPR